jgi:hypothetical protein
MILLTIPTQSVVSCTYILYCTYADVDVDICTWVSAMTVGKMMNFKKAMTVGKMMNFKKGGSIPILTSASRCVRAAGAFPPFINLKCRSNCREELSEHLSKITILS